LFVEELNAFRVGGFKLGFWFAQQGSIYTFVVLIFVYIRLMNRLDAAYLNAAELSESGAEQKSTP
jgi:putative solute:sodium symporter small subunit